METLDKMVIQEWLGNTIVTPRAYQRLLAEKKMHPASSPRQLAEMALEDGWAWLSLPHNVLPAVMAAVPGAPPGGWSSEELRELHFVLTALRLGVLMTSGGLNGKHPWLQMQTIGWRALDEISETSWALLGRKPVSWSDAEGLIAVAGPGIEESIVAGIRGEVRTYSCGVCGRIGQAGKSGPVPAYCSTACRIKAYRTSSSKSRHYLTSCTKRSAQS